MLGGALIGTFDAMTTTIRQAAVQLETPDALRGRVSSLYLMSAQGGPSLGNANMGWLAGMFGPAAALTIGGLVPILYAVGFLVAGRRVRDHRGARAPEPVHAATATTTDAAKQAAG